jgi:hypothetical protein
MLILGADRSIHALAAHFDLGEPIGSILGRLWTYFVLPASRSRCPVAGMRPLIRDYGMKIAAFL